ncbi:patched domain-containing protein 3-like [Centruroides vittatus]|uniref:patched domain-containing protein 3-like n=1 Tax=Centruroides vittatus TaxID=120091 RepID=UPI00350F3D35
MSWDCVDRFVSRIFYKLGKTVGCEPGYFVVVPLLLAGIFASGLQRIHYEDDPEYLFTPTNGRSKDERRVVENLFPMNSSLNFDLSRMTRPGKFGRVIAVAKDGGTMLRNSVFEEVLELDDLIQNMSVYWDDEEWHYKQTCAKQNGKCFENGILEIAGRISEVENRTLLLKYPLMTNDETYKTYFFAGNIGGVDVDDNGYVKSAFAINLMYYLDTSTPRSERRAAAWEAAFLEMVESLEFDRIEVAMFVSKTLTEELERNTQSVVPFFSLTVAVMLIFSLITCTMADCVRSKPWIGVLGCVSSTIAVGAAFGLIAYCGLEFIGINLAAPFLMLGIGMDDTFLLLAAWRQTDPTSSVEDRMAKTYSEAAVSVTITSLTNFISFCIGAITPFPSVRIFCIYTAMAVLFTYAFHLTFFGGCLAFGGYREKRNIHSFVCLPAVPKSLAKNRNILFRLFCTGGRNSEDPTNLEDNKEHALMVFFRDFMGDFLGRMPVKILVVIIFAAYLGVGIWGCLQVREGLERHKLSRSDSYSVTFYDLEDKYFRKYAYRIQVIVNATLDYSNPETQSVIESMLQKFEASPYVADSSLTESWLRGFLKFASDKRTSLFLKGFNLTNNVDFIRCLREVFFRFPTADYFEQDVVFNNDMTAITGSRFIIQAVDILNANVEKDMVVALRNIADSFPFPVTVFQQYFIYFDQFILVRETSIQSICVAVAVMMVISLVFIPNVNCAVWVAFSIISIEVGVIGYMTLWGVNLDSISMINLIMCIGFSVDFSAHISYAYFSSENTAPDERVKSALHSLGLPIFQGSISTILGVIALAFAPSYIFLTFFKTVFLVILFGALHGILLLPVLLSLSDTCCRRKVKKTTKQITAPYIISTSEEGKKETNTAENVCIPRPSYTSPTEMEERKAMADSQDKDLGLGTSGEESSDGSWKSPSEDLPRQQLAVEMFRHYLHPYRYRSRGDYANAAYIHDEEADTVWHSRPQLAPQRTSRDRIAIYHEQPNPPYQLRPSSWAHPLTQERHYSDWELPHRRAPPRNWTARREYSSRP